MQKTQTSQLQQVRSEMAQTTANIVGCLPSVDHLALRNDMEPSESNNTIVTSNTELLSPSGSTMPGTSGGHDLEANAAASEASERHAWFNSQQPNAAPASGVHGSPVSHLTSSPNRQPMSFKRLHRIVEQDEREPICIILFKWLLITGGAAMLGVVLVVMGEVIYAWTSGSLSADHASRALQRSIERSAAAANVSIDNATDIVTTDVLSNDLLNDDQLSS